MEIDKESLEEFKKLWKKEFGEKLSDEEARQKADHFVNIYRAVYGSAEFPDSDKRGDE